MTTTAATKSPARGAAVLGARLTLILVCLVWATHSSSLIALLAGNATSKVALHFQTTQISWFTVGPALLGTFVAPFIFRTATVYGKRRVMLIVACVAVVGDLIAALATSFPVLITGRAISGVYTSAAVLTYALTRDVFPKKSIGMASGAIAAGVAAVGLGGPFLSGWVLDTYGFRGSLWCMVVITAVTVVMLIAFIPESPVREERAPFDWAGATLLGAGVSAAVYGLGKGSDWGWTSGSTLGLIIGGLAAVGAFLVVEAKVSHPIFPIALLRRRAVWSMVIATTLVTSTAFSSGIVTNLLALYPHVPGLSAGLGITATRLAVVGIPSSGVMMIVAVVAGSWARRHDPRWLLCAGALIYGASMVVSRFYHYHAWQLAAYGSIGGVGLGLIVAASPILVIAAVRPREQALGNGAQNIVAGLLSAMFGQLIFVVMAHRGRVVQGHQFYTDASFINVYWLLAGLALLGALSTFLMPRMTRLDDVEGGEAMPSA